MQIRSKSLDYLMRNFTIREFIYLKFRDTSYNCTGFRISSVTYFQTAYFVASIEYYFTVNIMSPFDIRESILIVDFDINLYF